GEEASACPTEAPRPWTTFSTPAGSAVRPSSSQNRTALRGVSSLGLITIALPVTSAGAALRAIRKKGKFQGRIPATTPIGLRERRIVSPEGEIGRAKR